MGTELHGRDINFGIFIVTAAAFQSCPAIQVFTAKNLESGLAAAARSFCSQEVITDNNEVYKIFNFLKKTTKMGSLVLVLVALPVIIEIIIERNATIQPSQHCSPFQVILVKFTVSNITKYHLKCPGIVENSTSKTLILVFITQVRAKLPVRRGLRRGKFLSLKCTEQTQ